MRIGFVGLATPIAYDYNTPATKTKADLKSSPNPILDNPWGIMLMFDQIWFLTRSLCPENLRNADFVHFIDETDYLKKLGISDYRSLNFEKEENIDEKIKKTTDNFSDFTKKIKMRGIQWEALPDNHTHSLRIEGTNLHGNWANLRNILFDQVLLERLQELSGEYIEYIPNSFTYHWFTTEAEITDKVLSEEIIKVVFSNFISREGPYHAAIDEIRNIPEISDFRKFIIPKSENVSKEDAKKLAQDIRSELQYSMEEAYLNQLNRYGSYDSGLMFMIEQFTYPLNPTLNLFFQGKEALLKAKKIKDFHNLKWQAFIIKSDHILNNN